MPTVRIAAFAREALAAPAQIAGILVRLGPASTGLALLLVASYALLVAGAPPEGLTPAYLSASGGSLPPLVLEGQVWRLLTYGLLHAGTFHLVMNTVPLFVVGAMLNAEFGSARLLALFVLGVLAGGVAHVAFGGAEVVSGLACVPHERDELTGPKSSTTGLPGLSCRPQHKVRTICSLVLLFSRRH